jgi:GTP cyclohydrolase II
MRDSVTTSPSFPPKSSPELLAEAPIPTRHGIFRLLVFRWDDPKAHPGLSNEHLAMVMGDVTGQRNVPVRVHSECLTSEVFGSLKCDCRDQLDWAMSEIGRQGAGIVLYLRQEGRGIGLANKIRAYALQAQGADTIEANEQLHLPIDARQYDVAAAILRLLGVQSVELMTNNPLKIKDLSDLGIDVVQRIPVLVPSNPMSQAYLDTKRKKLHHELPSKPIHEPIAVHRSNGKTPRRAH